MHANLINVSGHRIPESVFQHLKKQNYNEYSVYTPNVCFDMSKDLWQQCENIIESLTKIKDSKNLNVFDREDTYNLMFIPAISAGALLLATSISKIIGIPPDLGIVSRINRKPELVQIINLRAWESKCRTQLRYKYTVKPCTSGNL